MQVINWTLHRLKACGSEKSDENSWSLSFCHPRESGCVNDWRQNFGPQLTFVVWTARNLVSSFSGKSFKLLPPADVTF